MVWPRMAVPEECCGCFRACFSHLNFHQCSAEFVGAALTQGWGCEETLGGESWVRTMCHWAMAGGAAQWGARSAVKIRVCQGVSHPVAGHWLGGWRSLSKDPIVNGEIWVWLSQITWLWWCCSLVLGCWLWFFGFTGNWLLVCFLPSSAWPFLLLRLFVCFSDETLFALPATSAPLMHSSAGKFFLLPFVWVPPAFLTSLTLSH